ncbi:MAG: cupin domain-containing protein [Aquabacterium sp.]|jgi:quercetin dioxygenase-like cupin family protein|nr:MAG: cupin domain-containing protein [Aquabacterium sp.]
MQHFQRQDIPVLHNSGIDSEQLLFPETAPEAKATITRVTVPVGKLNPRHRHEHSEQVWVVLGGSGTLLLEGEAEAPVNVGDVVRFGPGEVHGFRNSGTEPFVYMSVTTPPLNFRSAYAREWNVAAGAAAAAPSAGDPH